MPSPWSIPGWAASLAWANSPTFQLINFVLIACYVEVLVAEGIGLTAAIVAALTVAVGAHVTVAPVSKRSSEPLQA